MTSHEKSFSLYFFPQKEGALDQVHLTKNVMNAHKKTRFKFTVSFWMQCIQDIFISIDHTTFVNLRTL